MMAAAAQTPVAKLLRPPTTSVSFILQPLRHDVKMTSKGGKDQAKNKENERLWRRKRCCLLQELEERMKSAVNNAERYGSKARDMEELQ